MMPQFKLGKYIPAGSYTPLKIPVEMSAFTQAVYLYAALISFFLYTAFNEWFSKGWMFSVSYTL
jgi:hypothetical protein